MKFDITKTCSALLLYAETIDVINNNPARNKILFSNLCNHFKLKKKMKLKNFALIFFSLGKMIKMALNKKL